MPIAAGVRYIPGMHSLRPTRLLPLPVLVVGALVLVSSASAATILTGRNIKDGTITSVDVALNTLTAADLNTNSVGVLEIATNAVGAAELRASSVTGAEIATNAVGVTEIGTNAVGADEIAPGAVGTADLATGSVGSTQLADGGVANVDLGANAVTASKIADDAVGNSEIANDAVTASRIAANSVGESEIATGGVNTAEIDTDAVTSSELAINAVTTENLAAGAVTGDKLAAVPSVALSLPAAPFTVPNNTPTPVAPTWIESYDNGGLYDPANTGYVTVPRTGWYQVSGRVLWASTATTGDMRQLTIYTTDSTGGGLRVASRTREGEAPANSAFPQSVDGLVRLSAGERIVLEAFQTNSGANPVNITNDGAASTASADFRVAYVGA
ncbi:MAG: hypothetical protein JWM98_2677 [Thermoleophilia bacterium]|nr:hypothetical protein [Thermoleophilia bacterium]